VRGGHGVQLQFGAVLRQQAKAWLRETVQGVQCNAGDMQPSNFCTMQSTQLANAGKLICIRKNISTAFAQQQLGASRIQAAGPPLAASDSLHHYRSDVCAIDSTKPFSTESSAIIHFGYRFSVHHKALHGASTVAPAGSRASVCIHLHVHFSMPMHKRVNNNWWVYQQKP
jgi:hypothetical protein